MNKTAKKTSPDFQRRCIETGIAGLDDILGGGWSRGHLYLIEGEPGSGKTTMALQFLLAGRDAGESTIYFTLSESAQELRQSAASHGWSLEGIDIQELSPSPDELQPESQYTVFHPSEIELAQTTQAIIDRVEADKPTRVVVDALSELRMLAREPLRYRRQILALKRFFAGRDCTVILLDDRTSDGRDLQLHSISQGVLSLETLARDYGVQRRRMQVIKLRASAFREGYHDFIIATGGLKVFPRLIAAEHHKKAGSSVISSGIRELDSLLGGGINSGTSTLIAGPTGSGKSTIASWYAFESGRKGKKAAIFAFDEGKATLISRLSAMGWNADELLQQKKLTIDQVDPAELSPGEFVGRVRQMIENDGVRVLVIDSLNGLMNAMAGEERLVLQMHELLSFLNQQDIATLMTLAQSSNMGVVQSPVDLSYLADTVILLRYFESGGSVRKAISVFKKRSGPHEDTIREFRLTPKGIHVGEPLVNVTGVLAGIPAYTGETEELFAGNDQDRRKK